MPSKDYTIRDCWFTSGMRATGSNTIVTDNVFVPDTHVLELMALRDGNAPGSPRDESYIYRTPFFFYAPLTFVLPMLGAAQGAYAYFRDWTKDRSVARRGRAAELSSIQTGMARAAADLDAAQMLIDRAIATPRALDGDVGALLARSVRDYTRATEIIVQAIDGLVAISGTAGFVETNPIQRAWRDIHFASMHVSLNADINYGHFAHMEFGVPPDPEQPYFVKA